MSTDPKGILYYGIKLDTEPEWPDDDDYQDKNDAWKERHRPQQPEEDGGDYRTPEWDAWRAANRIYEASPKHVEIDWSGTDSCHDDGWYVHCPGLEKSVTWDGHLDLAGMTLDRNSEADAALKEFCEEFGLPYKQPSWHLACQYF